MLDYSELVFRIEPMQLNDIAQVIEIERVAFSSPWSASAYERELVYNESAHFFVERAQNDFVAAPKSFALGRWLKNALALGSSPNPRRDEIIGYSGFWLMTGEAHVMTIAVRPEWRGRHAGELLLVAMLDRAMELGATVMTLEVRVSNHPAQALYLKYGFCEAGLRVRYYSDNQEDGLIMTTSPLRSPTYQRQLETLKDALRQKLGTQ